jgi:hypothetical protein
VDQLSEIKYHPELLPKAKVQGDGRGQKKALLPKVKALFFV